MLVVQMNHRLDPDATPNTVLGPFHIDGSPPLAFGADMSDGVAGTPLFVHGTVRDLSGAPVAGAVLDVWQADGDGMYEAQLPSTRPGCGRSTPRARTAPTACARSRRSATRSRWTGRSAS